MSTDKSVGSEQWHSVSNSGKRQAQARSSPDSQQPWRSASSSHHPRTVSPVSINFTSLYPNPQKNNSARLSSDHNPSTLAVSSATPRAGSVRSTYPSSNANNFGASLIPPTTPSTESQARSDTKSPSVTGQAVISSTSSSFEKISLAQLNILLDSGKDKEGVIKWEQKAERIRGLLDSSGQEVFALFVRRAIILNWSTIFDSSEVPTHSTNALLREKIDEIRQDPLRSFQVADAIDAAREDIFKHFEVGKFVQHFTSDDVTKFLLAYAFTNCASHLFRGQAERFLVETVPPVQQSIARLAYFKQSLFTSSITAFLTGLFLYSEVSSKSSSTLVSCLSEVSQEGDGTIHSAIMSVSQLWKLPDHDRAIIDAFRKAGPRSGSTRHSIEDVINQLPAEVLTPSQIANTVLFMLFAQPHQHYNLSDLILALKSSSKARQIKWNAVIAAFDVPDLHISPDEFLRLFKALKQLDAESLDFDVQNLWSGVWHNKRTQVSFLRAFLDQNDPQLSKTAGAVPALQISDFDGLDTAVRTRISHEAESNWNNLGAIKAIFEVLLESAEMSSEEDGRQILFALVRNWLLGFVLSLSRLGVQPDKLNPNQESFVKNSFALFLDGPQPDAESALRGLFHQNRQLVFGLCMLEFQSDPRRLEVIYGRARDFDWIQFLLTQHGNPMAIDLACLRQKDEPSFSLDDWVSTHARRLAPDDRARYGETLAKYLRIKADDEYRAQKEQIERESVPLNLKAVNTILQRVIEYCQSKEVIKQAEATCLMTYPRLMNYGCGFDEILERSSAERGNKLSPDIDKRMSELFGQMYRDELSIRDMIGELREYKNSRDPQLQDLFCCIVHGLFDEYGCYGEYPEEALEKTALLFGNIIRFGILPFVPQDYGFSLVIESVRDFLPETPMYKFGVEVLLQMGDRLAQEPALCSSLLQIPTLEHEQILQHAKEAVQNGHSRSRGPSRNGIDNHELTNHNEDTGHNDAEYPPFSSVKADPPPASANFRDPDSKTQDTILFAINNLSTENMDDKLVDIKQALKEEHYQWFAAYLVEKRVRVEPNFQQMYFEFLSKMSAPLLMNEVVRETYVSVVRTLNSPATSDTAAERNALKSLGTWLGTITLAQDKPIKHRNVYFNDFLIEGYSLQRLVIVIAFTCRVLAKSADSLVFRPPNPWLLEILEILIELYHMPDLKLNQKFDIEVLCKDLGLDHKTIEPATVIQEWQMQQEDAITNASVLNEGEDFAELSLRGGRLHETISVDEIMQSLPPLEEKLKFPPTSGASQDHVTVMEIITRAVSSAIQEIIAPVVERSITIASLSTHNLVSKDYANESSADRYASAATEMVKSLAGQLALVTCKEPLRMSITNNIRQSLSELGVSVMAEGTILMTVNDNLDVAANLIKEAAEQRSIPEMQRVIEGELNSRRNFLEENPDGQSYGQELNRWATWIPSPYKLEVGGLNDAQRAVYEDFERRVHGMNAGHAQSMSTDATGRNLPDVLSDNLGMPSMTTPSAQSVLPHPSPLIQHDPRNVPVVAQTRVNGLSDGLPPLQRVFIMVDDLFKTVRDCPITRMKDLDNTNDSTILQDIRQILLLLTSTSVPQMEYMSRQTTDKLTSMLFTQPPQGALEAECFAFLLNKLCSFSDSVGRDITRWITSNEEQLLSNPYTTSAFMQYDLMEYARVDSIVAELLRTRNEIGLSLLAALIEQDLLCDDPIALRADFINSLIELAHWHRSELDNPIVTELSSKLRAHGIPAYVKIALDEGVIAKNEQMLYVFTEWCKIYENVAITVQISSSFLRDLHSSQLINSTEDLVAFLRISIDHAIECFEHEMSGLGRPSMAAAHRGVDGLAVLIIAMVRHRVDNDGAVKLDKAAYLNSILSLLVLIINNHHEVRGVDFHQRIFTRLFSTTLHEYASQGMEKRPDHDQMMLVFARTLRTLQPKLFPGFVFGWTSLLLHRVLVEGLLNSGHKECRKSYRELLGLMIQYPAALLDLHGSSAQIGESLSKGVWRNMYVLQNDYPDFIGENHAYLCSRISISEAQLRNVVVSAQPLGMIEVNPLTLDMKVERLDDMRRNPIVVSDVAAPLEEVGLASLLSDALKKNDSIDALQKRLLAVLGDEDKNQASFNTPAQDQAILASFVVILAQEVVGDGSTKFDVTANYMHIISQVLSHVSVRQQYLFLQAIFDQLRYPNTHTNFYCKVCLHLWLSSGELDNQIRNMMLRLLRERIDNIGPSPWGVLILFKELSDNSNYGFWDAAPFMAEPELRERLMAAVRAH